MNSPKYKVGDCIRSLKHSPTSYEILDIFEDTRTYIVMYSGTESTVSSYIYEYKWNIVDTEFFEKDSKLHQVLL